MEHRHCRHSVTIFVEFTRLREGRGDVKRKGHENKWEVIGSLTDSGGVKEEKECFERISGGDISGVTYSETGEDDLLSFRVTV